MGFMLPSDNLTLRCAVDSDRADILAIAAQIWDGDDYLPDVIDEWLKPGSAQLIVATLGGRVVGLGRCDVEFPGFAWLEGLRVDPAYQGQGVAKALTARMVAIADAAGVELAALSTYIDNTASQKVSAAFGFKPAVGFAYCEGRPENVQPHAAVSPRAMEVARDEAREFIRASGSLRAGAGYLAHSWRFYPFHSGPDMALGHMRRLWGIRDGERLDRAAVRGRRLSARANGVQHRLSRGRARRDDGAGAARAGVRGRGGVFRGNGSVPG
jgi:GNAT superfamily N-acetyltransferase